jgi:GPI biosynthesis protein family Pig-F
MSVFIAFSFGASLIENQMPTILWSLYSSLTLLQLIWAINPSFYQEQKEQWLGKYLYDKIERNETENLLYWSIVNWFFGAWLGCIVIPLDWGRNWQVN